MSSGGYDYEFVPELLHEFVCIICHLALRNPKKIETCGHQFCASCLNHMKNCANPRNEVTCPIDRQAFTAEQVFNDKGTERMILNWKVKCPNHKNGCEWVGELNTVENHDKECTHTMEGKFVCKNEACIEELQKKLLSFEESFESLLSMKKEFETLKSQMKNVESLIGPITSSEDPRTIEVTSKFFNWRCPEFDITERRRSSPNIYYKQCCFQITLYVDKTSTYFCVLLKRCRGKFDHPENKIRDVMPSSFQFIVTLRGINESVDNLVVTDQTTWVINEGSDVSFAPNGKILVYDLASCSDYIIDGFYHLECKFCEEFKAFINLTCQ